MKTIQATVSKRLLVKASRLFTGSVQGRIIEILQNARRAGATKVEITNKDGHVSVKDNGSGIVDFTRLLDLGASGWDGAMEASEDPAGVGVFCLAPRTVVIRSNGRTVIIEGDGWTGEAVAIEADPEPVPPGTVPHFEDDEWSHSAVDLMAPLKNWTKPIHRRRQTRAPSGGRIAPIRRRKSSPSQVTMRLHRVASVKSLRLRQGLLAEEVPQ